MPAALLWPERGLCVCCTAAERWQSQWISISFNKELGILGFLALVGWPPELLVGCLRETVIECVQRTALWEEARVQCIVERTCGVHWARGG